MRYRINLIWIYSYQTGTLSSVTTFCNEYKRKKEGNWDKERLKTNPILLPFEYAYIS